VRRILYAVLAATVVSMVVPSPVGALETKPVAKPKAAHHLTAPSRAVPLLAGVASTNRLSIAQLRAEWQHVAICEVGGNWSMTGPRCSGIGFLNSTWYQYGGTRFAPLAGQASVDQQILIGMRVTGGWVPDQYGCSRNGW